MRFLNHYRRKIALFSIFVMLSVLFFGATPAVADELTTENMQPIGQGQEETSDPRAITLGKVWFETTSTIPISYAPYPNISAPTSYSVQPNTGGWILGRTYDCYYIHYDVPNGKALRGYVPISSLNPQTYTWINYDVFLPATCTATTQVISGPGTTNTYYAVGEIYAGEDPLMVLGTEVNQYNNVTYYYVQYQTSSGLSKRGWIDPRLGTVTIQNLNWSNLYESNEFLIMNVSSGKFLYWDSDNTITQKSLCDADRQLFKIEKSDVSGYYRILPSRNTSLALSINTNSFHEGLSVIVETKAPIRKGQEFYIEEDGVTSTYQPKYGILTRVTGNFRGVEVYASSSAEGASVIQSLYYGNPNQQWVFISVLEWPAKIFYDENCGYTATQLKNLYKQATLGILEKYKVDFKITTVESSSTLTAINCPNTQFSVGCSSACGTVNLCHTMHHKSGPRYGNLMSVNNYYTCSFIRHRLCMYQNGGHLGNGSYILNGVGNVCGKEAVISTYEKNTAGNDAIILHIQHELTHNLGATDSGCITANMGTEKCVLFGSLNNWCYNCETSIRTYLEGGA